MFPQVTCPGRVTLPESSCSCGCAFLGESPRTFPWGEEWGEWGNVGRGEGCLRIKNLNESDGPETLKQIKEIIGNHQTRDGGDAILYKILAALQAVYKLNSLLLSPDALKTSVMGVFLESAESLCWCHIQPDTQPVKISHFNSILHIASQSIPPYLLATSIVSPAMESFESGDPVAARLIAFRGQEAIKGRHSIVLTILKETKLHVTSLIWLPWESPDMECDTVMSRLLPGYLTGFLDPCCGDSQWM
ncbi:uncharacterized protein EI90DRAFT_3020184 [Cantharellus anzutake]|uniref:uncharacterized protein n=1 Tax=Cantharellus anzutake TaxID=1750568 RepID=UPI001907A2B8|nr:uncharacterized protein EI90DRAFT_3020184 [Cantharellus anzutake]KAF8321924.1 hypothetical protein EI90DRAFT_3020184 [Cantharellus anzutake]